jgi:hypothetical protein
LFDIARGWSQAGKREEAAAVLLDADQLAPEEVRCRPASRRLVNTLVRSFPPGVHPSAAFKRLAKAAGVLT